MSTIARQTFLLALRRPSKASLSFGKLGRKRIQPMSFTLWTVVGSQYQTKPTEEITNSSQTRSLLRRSAPSIAHQKRQARAIEEKTGYKPYTRPADLTRSRGHPLWRPVPALAPPSAVDSQGGRFEHVLARAKRI